MPAPLASNLFCTLNAPGELLRLEELQHGWLAVIKAIDLGRNFEAVGAFYQLKFFFPPEQSNPFAP